MQKWVAVPYEQYLLLERGETQKEVENCREGAGKQVKLDKQEIVASIPKQSRRNAMLILHHLERNPKVTWNSKGELVVEGEVVPRSHMVDLLKDVFYKYKTLEAEGILPFYKALADSNLPVSIVKNPERRRLFESYLNPKPPGILASSWLTLKRS